MLTILSETSYSLQIQNTKTYLHDKHIACPKEYRGTGRNTNKA